MTTTVAAMHAAKSMPISRGFPVRLLEAVRCPNDGRRLAAADGSIADYLTEATVRCAGCDVVCEIRKGILHLLPIQRPITSLARSEQDARDRGAHDYDAHFSEWSNAVEMRALLADRSLFLDKIVLDLGCGTGRMTTRLMGAARAVLAADLSERSLLNLAEKAAACSDTQLGLVWGDATQLSLAPRFFDTVICAQLLEHIPLLEQRSVLLEKLSVGLKPSGSLLLTAYHNHFMKRILRRPREGFHENGIFYRRFTRQDLEQELSAFFSVLEIKPLQIDPHWFPQQSSARGWLARIMESTVCARFLGHLVFARARKEMST